MGAAREAGVSPLFSVVGKVAIVTGASSGIGRALAIALSEAGSRVVACARTEPRLPRPKEGALVCTSCDVTSAHDRRELVRTTMESFGQIDALINSAGASVSGNAFDEDPAQRRVVLETNVLAVLELSAEVAKAMRAAKSGSIINLASLAAFRSFDRIPLPTYAASKAAVVAITRELAAELGPDQIRVNALAPGFFPTPMTRFLKDEDELAWIRAHTPLGREGQIADLLGPIVFLMSDASRYVTGQTLAVDGGWTCY
jgi:NAD(P)-dependent dehydrogenase (short-subunit alcohol dehydrogenase family)